MYSSVMQTNSCHSNIYRFADFCPKAKKTVWESRLLVFCFSSLWLNDFVCFRLFQSKHHDEGSQTLEVQTCHLNHCWRDGNYYAGTD